MYGMPFWIIEEAKGTTITIGFWQGDDADFTNVDTITFRRNLAISSSYDQCSSVFPFPS
jgi:hypothetical protein